MREGHIAQRDAPTIAHLRQAGAVFVGKTNLHEFAFGTTNEDSAFGPARNPLDSSRSPGGSSGGSAASVAAGMALATLGTCTGGSIRIPAAACGIVGLKPSYGEVSTEGIVPLSRTFDHAGPLAQTAADACLVYHALLGDAGAVPPAPMPVKGMRLAVPRRYFCDLLDDEVRARFEEALHRLRDAGAHVADVDLRHAGDIAAIYLLIVLADAAEYHAATLETMPDRYTAPVRLRLEMGQYVLAEDYVRALAGRDVLRREVDAALAQHDALVLPTLPIPAPRSARRPSKWERRPSRYGTSCSGSHSSSMSRGTRRSHCQTARRRPGCRAVSSSSGAAAKRMCSCAWRSAASVTR